MLLLFLIYLAHIAIAEGKTHREYNINHTNVVATSPKNTDNSHNNKDQSNSENTKTSAENDTAIDNVKLNSEPLIRVEDEGNKELKVTFTDDAAGLLKELTNALEKVNANLGPYNKSLKRIARTHRRHNSRDQAFDMIPPLTRYKRSIKNGSEVETANRIDIPSTFKIKIPDNATETTKDVTDETIDSDVSDDWLVNNNDTVDGNLTMNGRRSFNSDMQIANVLRSRLLSYVHDNINETMHKINSLKHVKNSYANNNAFNIGYILANVDLVDINLKKLRDGIEKNHNVWAESHILDVYDKVKYTNDVITSLLNALKTVVDNRSNVNEYVYVK